MELKLDKPGAARTALGLLLVGALALVGFLDYLTGPWLSFALLYVAPVLAAAWWLGRAQALAAGATAGVAWFVAEAWNHRGEPTRDLLWNSGSRLVMLIAMGLMVVRIRADRARLQAANRRLADLLDGAERLARTDPLTGLPNRRAFLERLTDELARSKRSGGAICVAYLDIDNFKRLNDRDGHADGDQFLKDVGHAIRDTVRSTDVAARLGGDEFAVLLIDSKPGTTEQLAHRLLQRLRTLGDRHPGLGLGASIGMALFDKPPERAEEILQRADAAMYQAKSAGKHRFALWTPEAVTPVLQE